MLATTAVIESNPLARPGACENRNPGERPRVSRNRNRKRIRRAGSEAITPAFVYCSVGFEPLAVLPPELHRHADFARYLVHRIICGLAFGQDDDKGFVPLKAESLRRFVPNNLAYTAVRRALLERGVIQCDNTYIKGEKSMGYKLGPELTKMRHIKIKIDDPVLTKKLLGARKERAVAHAKADVYGYLYRCLSELDIDYPAALEDLIGDEHEFSDETSIQLIRDREFHFHVCDYGRVHTNLTNLKSRMRRFLTHQGRLLVNLDIRNSQPLFFGVLLAEEYRSKPMPEDVRLYLRLVQDGLFYDHLMDAGGISAEGRSRFKREFFGQVFFCRNDPIKESARMFGDAFPNVYASIRSMKADDYCELAHRLQRAESDLMIGGVASRIVRELPDAWIATIHDSIVTTSGQAESVKAIMLEEFAKIGLRPTINTETLGWKPSQNTVSP
jgi:hypothetical protein